MEETLISDDDNRIINIIAENPYVLTAKKLLKSCSILLD